MQFQLKPKHNSPYLNGYVYSKDHMLAANISIVSVTKYPIDMRLAEKFPSLGIIELKYQYITDELDIASNFLYNMIYADGVNIIYAHRTIKFMELSRNLADSVPPVERRCIETNRDITTQTIRYRHRYKILQLHMARRMPMC